MIVIMGASGRVGGAATRTLVQKGEKVRGIGRRISEERHEAVNWVKADALNTSALAKAFQGAKAVFVLNPVSAAAQDVHAEADRLSASIAEALCAASVPYVVALSSQGAHLAEGTGVVATLHRFEAALKRTGIALTVLRPAYFMESWIPLSQHALRTGELLAFLNPVSRAIDAVSTQDVGAIAAHYLTAPEPSVVNIAGPARYSDADAADALERLYGRSMRMVSVPAQDIAATLEASGLGRSLSAETAAMYQAINGPGIPFEKDAGTYITGFMTLKDVFAGTDNPL